MSDLAQRVLAAVSSNTNQKAFVVSVGQIMGELSLQQKTLTQEQLTQATIEATKYCKQLYARLSKDYRVVAKSQSDFYVVAENLQPIYSIIAQPKEKFTQKLALILKDPVSDVSHGGARAQAIEAVINPSDRVKSSITSNKDGSKILVKVTGPLSEKDVAAVKKVLKSENWAKHTTVANDMLLELNQKIKAKKTTVKKSPNKAGTTSASKPVKVTQTRVSLVGQLPETEKSWNSIIALINEQLHDVIKDLMQSPKLVYRTGRFARSAQVDSVTFSSQGYPTFKFSYMSAPYDVFDRVRGAMPWNTPDRDPKTLIAEAIRKIAKDLQIGRFYTKRS